MGTETVTGNIKRTGPDKLKGTGTDKINRMGTGKNIAKKRNFAQH